MTVLKLKLPAHNLDELVTYLIRNVLFDYEKHSSDMTILLSENFYFRNMSAQLNMVILKKEASFILIDIIGGAGGTGLLNIDWGSEKGYTSKIRKVIMEYASEMQIKIEVLNPD